MQMKSLFNSNGVLKESHWYFIDDEIGDDFEGSW